MEKEIVEAIQHGVLAPLKCVGSVAFYIVASLEFFPLPHYCYWKVDGDELLDICGCDDGLVHCFKVVCGDIPMVDVMAQMDCMVSVVMGIRH